MIALASSPCVSGTITGSVQSISPNAEIPADELGALEKAGHDPGQTNLLGNADSVPSDWIIGGEQRGEYRAPGRRENRQRVGVLAHSDVVRVRGVAKKAVGNVRYNCELSGGVRTLSA